MYKPFFNIYTPKPVTRENAEAFETKSPAQRLNQLVEQCKDSLAGYEKLLERAPNTLNDFLQQLIGRRSRMAAELQRAVIGLGETPEGDGTLSGKLHRRWINLRQTLASNDEKLVLMEVKKAEEDIAEACEKALKSNLEPQTRSLVETHYTETKRVQDRIEKMLLARQH